MRNNCNIEKLGNNLLINICCLNYIVKLRAFFLRALRAHILLNA